MNEVARETDIGEQSAALLAEVLTVANAGREAAGEPRLTQPDVRLALSFWEWLFDGLVRR
jgi:hypothetical protein